MLDLIPYATYCFVMSVTPGPNNVMHHSQPVVAISPEHAATVAKDGRVVFTSVRDGDMELYSMNADGS